MSGQPPRSSLTLPVGASLLFHVAAITALVILRPAAPPAMPPVYRVELIAAPPGPRAVGVVRDQTPAVETPKPTVAPPKSKPVPKTIPTVAKTAPAKAPPKVTKTTPAPPEVKTKPVNSKTPTAGGGPEGGTGTDVANVSTPGIAFAFPVYIQNIVRVVALRWHPPANSTLSAEVVFLIHRDGSVTDFRFQKRSGSFTFDLAAQGAIDAAGTAHAFGPLPALYADDVLPVIFTFDPRIIH